MVRTTAEWEEIDAPHAKPVAKPAPELSDKQKAALEAAEAHRLNQRAKLKAEGIECQLADAQLQSIVAEIETKNTALDALAAEHAQELAEVQAELKSIADEQLSTIKAGKPLDVPKELRRRELLQLVQTKNDELEKSLDTIKAEIVPLEKERINLAYKAGSLCSVRTQLMTSARPDLAQRLRTANSASRWAAARHAAAREKLAENRRFRPHLIANFESEVEAAAENLAHATQAAADAVAACIDE